MRYFQNTRQFSGSVVKQFIYLFIFIFFNFIQINVMNFDDTADLILLFNNKDLKENNKDK